MRIGITSDSPSWTKVDKISDELEELSVTFQEKYSSLDWKLVVCIRCLQDSVDRKTFARYYTQEKILALDISMKESLFTPYKKSVDTQRALIGKNFFEFFEITIKKYEKKLPGLKELSESLIGDVKQWCIDNKWLVS